MPENNHILKDQLRRLRIRYCFILVVIVGLLIILLGILTPSLVIHDLDIGRKSRYLKQENEALYLWMQLLETSVFNGCAVAYQLEGFVLSNIRTIPSLDSSPEQRLEDQYFDRFPTIASSLIAADANIELLALLPGGVVSQTVPYSEEYQGVDMFKDFSYILNQVIDAGIADLGGPVKSLINSTVYVGTVIAPVFNTTDDVRTMTDKEEILKLFWGFVFVEVDVSALIVNSGLPDTMHTLGMSYVLYTVRHGKYTILATSDSSMDQDATAKFIDTATRVEPVNTDLQLTLAISKTRKLVVLTPSILACIVCGVGTLGVMLMALAALLIACRTKTYVGTESAPKAAPFATLVIGPLQGEELWNLLPDHMTDITEALGKVLERHMRRHRGYQIPQLQPYTTTYILRTMEDAIGMAFDVIEDIQRHPLDEDMVRTLGDNGHLLLTYGVHWCCDAKVTLEPASGRLRYEGPDVLRTGRLWRRGMPSRVVVSGQGRDALVCREWRVEPLSSCVLRQGEPETALFTVTDLARPLLKAAQIVADELIVLHVVKKLNPFLRENCPHRNIQMGFLSRLPRSTVSQDDVSAMPRSLTKDWGVPRGGPSDEVALVNNSLIEPRISTSLATALRTAFDEQGVTVEIGYDSVRVLVYYFYAFFKILFKPLAAPQRSNIYMRLITAFGLRQEALLENLAVNCTIRYLQQQEERSHQRNRQHHGERNHYQVSVSTLERKLSMGVVCFLVCNLFYELDKCIIFIIIISGIVVTKIFNGLYFVSIPQLSSIEMDSSVLFAFVWMSFFVPVSVAIFFFGMKEEGGLRFIDDVQQWEVRGDEDVKRWPRDASVYEGIQASVSISVLYNIYYHVYVCLFPQPEAVAAEVQPWNVAWGLRHRQSFHSFTRTGSYIFFLFFFSYMLSLLPFLLRLFKLFQLIDCYAYVYTNLVDMTEIQWEMRERERRPGPCVLSLAACPSGWSMGDQGGRVARQAFSLSLSLSSTSHSRPFYPFILYCVHSIHQRPPLYTTYLCSKRRPDKQHGTISTSKSDPYIKEFSIYSLQSFYIFFLPSFLLLAVYSEIEIQTSPIGIIAVSLYTSSSCVTDDCPPQKKKKINKKTNSDIAVLSSSDRLFSVESLLFYQLARDADIKEQDRQVRRRYWLFLLVIVAGMLLILLGILTPSLVINNLDVVRQNKYKTEENEAVYQWKQLLEASVISGFTVASHLEGFVFSNMRRLPSLHGPVEERLEDQFFERFPIIAKSLMTGDQEIELVALVPGGIVSQTMPHSDRFQNVDLFKYLPLTLNAIIAAGIMDIGGPVMSLGDNNIYVVNVVIPVFNTTEDVSKMEDKSGILDLFWGFVFVEVDIHSLIVHSDVPQRMKELGMSYVLYSVINDEYVVLATSDHSMNQDAIAKFISSSTRVEPVNTDLELTLAIKKFQKVVHLTPAAVAGIVCGVGTLGVMLMALAALLIACRTKTYVGTESAPKAAPFATLVIGPLQGEELWNLLPDHMTDITEALGKVLERHMRRHRGYQIPQLQPYTTTYILRTMEDAIGMAFDVIEDIQRHPLDEDMVRTLGGQRAPAADVRGALVLRCESHAGACLWSAALRGPRCAAYGEAVAEGDAEPLRACCARGEPETALFTVTDLARPLLKAAQAEAEEGSLKMNGSAAKVLNPFSRERRRDSRTGFHHSTFPEAVPSKNSVNDDTRSPGEESRDPSDELGLVNNSLIEPRISTSLATALRTAFDEQGVTVEIGYDSVRVLVYYFYAFFKILFKPLAAPQRSNIYMRLITAFGLRQEALLENLAVNCTIRYLQQQEEANTYHRNRQKYMDHYRLEMLWKSTVEYHSSVHSPSPLSASFDDDRRVLLSLSRFPRIYVTFDFEVCGSVVGSFVCLCSVIKLEVE
eukprot:gene7064-5004_t